MTLDEAIIVTRERRDWLAARIEAKRTVGWDTTWDERERDAHSVLLVELTAPGKWLDVAPTGSPLDGCCGGDDCVCLPLPEPGPVEAAIAAAPRAARAAVPRTVVMGGEGVSYNPGLRCCGDPGDCAGCPHR